MHFPPSDNSMIAHITAEANSLLPRGNWYDAACIFRKEKARYALLHRSSSVCPESFFKPLIKGSHYGSGIAEVKTLLVFQRWSKLWSVTSVPKQTFLYFYSKVPQSCIGRVLTGTGKEKEWFISMNFWESDCIISKEDITPYLNYGAALWCKCHRNQFRCQFCAYLSFCIEANLFAPLQRSIASRWYHMG